MLWLGLAGIVSMSAAGIGQAAPVGTAALWIAAVGAAVAQESPVSATGVVQQVKAEQGKVKIDHDPIPALGWPKMNMYFRVKDKAVLDGIGPGDKVRFELEKDAKGLAITRIEKAAK
jgi:Cu(I)/Ag(I) efflux system protein CusF